MNSTFGRSQPAQRRPVKRAFSGLACSPSARVVETEELRRQREKEEAQAAASIAAEQAADQRAERLGKLWTPNSSSVSKPD